MQIVCVENFQASDRERAFSRSLTTGDIVRISSSGRPQTTVQRVTVISTQFETILVLNESLPDSLTEFVNEVDSTEWSAQIINRTEPEPIEEMLQDLFRGLSISTTETDIADADDDVLLLLHDNEVVESSPLSEIRDTLLLVNSDIYKTGAREIDEIDPPDIITELSDTVFTLRGYPESDIEKLVLTLVSRYIEHQSWIQETGTLRTSFQRLSRLDDEQGTKTVYERLGQLASLDVHVYGVPDWNPPESMGVTAHGVADDEIMRHWFVVFAGSDARSVAMLAVKTGVSEWEGYWTFDTDEIQAMNEYISQTF